MSRTAAACNSGSKAGGAEVGSPTRMLGPAGSDLVVIYCFWFLEKPDIRGHPLCPVASGQKKLYSVRLTIMTPASGVPDM